MNKDYDNKGLSLIELLITLSIFCIIVLLALPKFFTNDYELVQKTRLLGNDIRMARYLGMSKSAGMYEVYFGKDSYKFSYGIKIIKEVNFGKNFEMLSSFTKSRVNFNRNGHPNGGGTVTIYDKRTGKFCDITIIPGTGRILIKDKIYENEKLKINR
ncbi:N-terminal methylation site-containing protein, prepilin-type [Gottschalkia purinilytica]|uniref:N-terminal methylation site-containing protein, prepilin-type n=1 Tax=Gottschalkia purinilytica TaxID=1503 RepID=A0A0L0W762_GOTPU|nr:prepilin-type N-terminal cleavage/methylation domain-containing protein [Gottschalkia purinilytica]KNF07388.1 N-terminal methylation site-containing protein, prepilin-type [Gottschalkia purinilytica]